MIDCFVPFTAFHYASAIRAIESGIWSPNCILLLHGAGTTLSPSGKLYSEAFRRRIRSKGIRIVEIRYSYITLLSIPMRYRRYSFQLLTGNPRRSEILFLGRFAENILLLDDGLGSIVTGGYFDVTVPEQSSIKRILIFLRILAPYVDIYRKIALHATIFERSIFPNPILTPFNSIIPLLTETAESFDCVFVSSFLREDQIDAYIDWVRKFFAIPPHSMISIHPAMPAERAERLAAELGLKILNTGGMLLEEYIFGISLQRDIRVIGQENTSTQILQQLKSINVECRSFATGS